MHRLILLNAFCSVFLLIASGQEQQVLSLEIKPPINYYDSDLLSKGFHQERREELRKIMPDSSAVVVFASPVRNRSNDVDFEYHQDPNFYYLTGLNEPHTVVLIFKDSIQIDSIVANEIIYMQPRDQRLELWNGKRIGPELALDKLGFNQARVNHSFPDLNLNLDGIKTIYYQIPQNDVRDNANDRGDLASMVRHFQLKLDTVYPEQQSWLKESMAKLRQIKQPKELELMRKAIDFTCEAQMELMKALLPGWKEYQSEALVEYIFKNNGAEYQGFPSIVGGGENSCVLHYVSNRKTLTWDDLLVCDIGAEYHGYTADVTRTLPVDGEYSQEEKTIYNIVLEAQLAGIAQCIAGNKFWDPNKAAREIIQTRLMELGIIQNERESIKYFPHGTSHYLGLDVHDAGLYGPLEPGNVITVEPGIYIHEGADCDEKWWNIGVRIEDDVLITTGAPEVLSDCVPKLIEEVEAIMKKESLFNHYKSSVENK